MKKHKRPDLMRPPHAVFTKVDMQGGDPHKCWPWLGTVTHPKGKGPGKPVIPIHHFKNTRVMARRLIYSLKHGVAYKDVPHLIMLCDGEACCNFHHMSPRKDARLNHPLATKLDKRKEM